MNIEALRQEAEQKITEAIAEFSAKANVEVTMYYDGLRYNRLPGADLMRLPALKARCEAAIEASIMGFEVMTGCAVKGLHLALHVDERTEPASRTYTVRIGMEGDK